MLSEDNNILNANIKVKNYSNSPGGIYVRIENEDKEVLYGDYYVERGKTVYIGKIPWNTGKFYVYACAAKTAGKYKILVRD